MEAFLLGRHCRRQLDLVETRRRMDGVACMAHHLAKSQGVAMKAELDVSVLIPALEGEKVRSRCLELVLPDKELSALAYSGFLEARSKVGRGATVGFALMDKRQLAHQNILPGEKIWCSL